MTRKPSPAYAASKAALELYTEALHLELAGTGVQAQLFVPGTTRTEFKHPKPGKTHPFCRIRVNCGAR